MEKDKETAPAAQDHELVLALALDAPKELVFKAWTEAEHLGQWWGPKGFHLEVAHLDAHPGGTFHYSMQSGDSPKMWGKFVYQEITSPEGLVFVNSFADKEGNILRAPFSATWPKEMLNRVTLTQSNGQTILTLKISAHNATPEEQQTFLAGFDSMRQGFSGTFENLAAYLGKKTE